MSVYNIYVKVNFTFCKKGLYHIILCYIKLGILAAKDDNLTR